MHATTPRQRREQAFWDTKATLDWQQRTAAVDLAPALSEARRPWSAFWSCYDHVRAAGLAGQRVLVLGCGYGDDAIRLAVLGAEVHALDISSGAIAVATARSRLHGGADVAFHVGTAEDMPLATGMFDLIFVNVALHHCALRETLDEVARVARPGARVILREPYMHSRLQRIKQRPGVSRFVRPILRRLAYGNSRAFASDDEQPLTEADVAVLARFIAIDSTRYFNGLSGRIVPEGFAGMSRLEQRLYARVPWMAKCLAGCIVLHGTVRRRPDRAAA